jgi:RNA-directed DNA polymerase
MKESHRKDLASHPDPESCGSGRKTTVEALTGAHAGQPSSCEITVFGVPTRSTQAEGNIAGGASGKLSADPAQSKTLCMRGNSSHGNREVPQAPAADGATGRPEKVVGHTSGMYACGKSDGRIVPGKPSNKGTRLAEAVEGRRPAKGNTRFTATCRTQSRGYVPFVEQRVREAAPDASPP